MPDPVIIVDANGVEHEFPPGFDPKRAGLIVQGRTGAVKLPTRPVSAEDFMPPQKSGLENAIDTVAGFGRRTIGAIPEMASAAGDLALSTVNQGAAQRTQDRLRAMGTAQVDQFRKAADDAGAGFTGRDPRRLNAAVAHAMAGALPVVGPAAANIGEQFETDPYGALGEGAGLLLTSSPSAMRATGRGVAATGRAAGRGAAAVATSPEVGTAAGSAVGASMGGPLGAVAGGVTGRALSALFRRVLEEAKDPAGLKSSIAEKQRIVDEAQSALDYRYTQQTPPQVPAPAPPTPSVPQAPAQTPAPSAAAPTPRPSATMGPRNYFLRQSSAPVEAAPPAPAAQAPIDVANLPMAWRSRTMQHVGPSSSAEAQQLADGLRQVIDETGVSISQAVNAVAKQKDLPPNVRLELMQALTTMRARRK